jgi:trk system potassium uptake protein TrkH
MTIISLMVIGGSPASAAGGMKTVTFAILVATTIGALRHRQNVETYGRTVDFSLIRRSMVVTFIYIGLVWAITFGLVFAQPQMSFMELLFESSSACGTVGLSMGVSPNLGLEGKLLDILGMFAGRLGPLTLLFAMAGRPKKAQYEYPTEGLITG